MSLVCVEHGDHNVVGGNIYGVLLAGPRVGAVFCVDALALIPIEVRRTQEVSGGVNVHVAATDMTYGNNSGQVARSDLYYGRRLFSVDRSDFVRCLPGTARMLLG